MNAQVEEAIAYASLIADICKLTGRKHDDRTLEHQVFKRMGYETTTNGRGHMMRKVGESHWQALPRILTDFGTAVYYTIGHRYGTLDHPLEENWYVSQMCEDSEVIGVDGTRIATWAVRLAKHNKTAVDATAISPAATLVAAWLRTHP